MRSADREVRKSRDSSHELLYCYQKNRLSYTNTPKLFDQSASTGRYKSFEFRIPGMAIRKSWRCFKKINIDEKHRDWNEPIFVCHTHKLNLKYTRRRF